MADHNTGHGDSTQASDHNSGADRNENHDGNDHTENRDGQQTQPRLEDEFRRRLVVFSDVDFLMPVDFSVTFASEWFGPRFSRWLIRYFFRRFGNALFLALFASVLWFFTAIHQPDPRAHVRVLYAFFSLCGMLYNSISILTFQPKIFRMALAHFESLFLLFNIALTVLTFGDLLDWSFEAFFMVPMFCLCYFNIVFMDAWPVSFGQVQRILNRIQEQNSSENHEPQPNTEVGPIRHPSRYVRLCHNFYELMLRYPRAGRGFFTFLYRRIELLHSLGLNTVAVFLMATSTPTLMYFFVECDIIPVIRPRSIHLFQNEISTLGIFRACCINVFLFSFRRLVLNILYPLKVHCINRRMVRIPLVASWLPIFQLEAQLQQSGEVFPAPSITSSLPSAQSLYNMSMSPPSNDQIDLLSQSSSGEGLSVVAASKYGYNRDRSQVPFPDSPTNKRRPDSPLEGSNYQLQSIFEDEEDGSVNRTPSDSDYPKCAPVRRASQKRHMSKSYTHQSSVLDQKLVILDPEAEFTPISDASAMPECDDEANIAGVSASDCSSGQLGIDIHKNESKRSITNRNSLGEFVPADSNAAHGSMAELSETESSVAVLHPNQPIPFISLVTSNVPPAVPAILAIHAEDDKENCGGNTTANIPTLQSKAVPQHDRHRSLSITSTIPSIHGENSEWATKLARSPRRSTLAINVGNSSRKNRENIIHYQGSPQTGENSNIGNEENVASYDAQPRILMRGRPVFISTPLHEVIICDSGKNMFSALFGTYWSESKSNIIRRWSTRLVVFLFLGAASLSIKICVRGELLDVISAPFVIGMLIQRIFVLMLYSKDSVFRALGSFETCFVLANCTLFCVLLADYLGWKGVRVFVCLPSLYSCFVTFCLVDANPIPFGAYNRQVEKLAEALRSRQRLSGDLDGALMKSYSMIFRLYQNKLFEGAQSSANKNHQSALCKSAVDMEHRSRLPWKVLWRRSRKMSKLFSDVVWVTVLSGVIWMIIFWVVFETRNIYDVYPRTLQSPIGDWQSEGGLRVSVFNILVVNIRRLWSYYNDPSRCFTFERRVVKIPYVPAMEESEC